MRAHKFTLRCVCSCGEPGTHKYNLTHFQLPKLIIFSAGQITGGQDWRKLIGWRICSRCYNRFRDYGRLELCTSWARCAEKPPRGDHDESASVSFEPQLAADTGSATTSSAMPESIISMSTTTTSSTSSAMGDLLQNYGSADDNDNDDVAGTVIPNLDLAFLFSSTLISVLFVFFYIWG